MESGASGFLITEGALVGDVSANIVPPERRTCQLCGRIDVWDEEVENWVIAAVDGERRVGNKHCIHEWDINGRYNPVEGKPDVNADADV